jgi:hypothetical protein
MPCVVLDNQDWSDNFNSKYFHKVNIKDAGETIVDIYCDLQSEEALDYVRKLDDEVAKGWINFLYSFVSKQSNINTAKINTYETVNYTDYLTELNRGHYNRDDFISVYNNRYKFCNLTYTDEHSYLSKDPTFKPVEEEAGLSLFEGL